MSVGTSKLARFNAWFGIGFAALLTIIETIHNWGDWSEPAFWIIDYLACLLLAAGGWLTLSRKHQAGLPVLGIGWGFACAMFWMAYFLIRQESVQKPELADPLVLNTALALFVATIIGMAISLYLIVKDEA